MKSALAHSYSSFSDLPRTIGIFPLTGALLLPRGQLPLNVFEPRYIALVDAAMSGNRLIGMIQPRESELKSPAPSLADIGCAGRLTAWRETDDGRYLITLTGVCRFKVKQELNTLTLFRQVEPDFEHFAVDLAGGEDTKFPRERLLQALNEYLSRRELKADWKSVVDAPAEALVTALAMLCPFEPSEKQALLEAPNLEGRVNTLVALLEMSGAVPGPKTLN